MLGLSLSLPLDVAGEVVDVAASGDSTWMGLRSLFWPRPKINVNRNARKAARVPNSVINIGYISNMLP